MENNKIKRFYIMPEVWVTVTQSQVFNWVKLINDNGISTDCISITDNKHNVKEVSEIEKLIKGRFIEVHDFKRLILSDIYITFVLLKYYFRSLKKNNKIIFQSRISLGLAFAVLKFLPRVKVILETRGAGNEEQYHITDGNKETIKQKIKKFFDQKNEKLTVFSCDKIFSVSNALADYFQKKYILPKSKFTVFPGAADTELFFFDNGLRKIYRSNLGLKTEDILIVYSGRLDMKWEIPEKVLAFFKNLNDKNSSFKLLLLTPDIELANKLVNEFDLMKKVFVKKVDFESVNKYLNASDVGILLREDIPMNNVASPTKFAEYLMAGLPVIISAGILDFAQLISEQKLGTVVLNTDRIASDEYKVLLSSLKLNPIKIARWGKENLSKEIFVKKYIKELKSI